MKFTIACVLLLAVAAQTQLIGVDAGYPSLLPAATDAAPSRAKRQIQLGYFRRRGRSLNEVEPTGTDFEMSSDADSSRTKRQIGVLGNSFLLPPPSWRRPPFRRGRSVNEMTEPETSPDTLEKSIDAAPSRAKRQVQLGYLRRRGRSLNEVEPTGVDYESVDADPSRTKYQTQLQYGGNRPGRSLNNPSWSTA